MRANLHLGPLALALLISLGFSEAAGQGAPLIEGLGGPLDLGEAVANDGPLDESELDEAFPNGLQFFNQRVRGVFINRTAILSFGGPGCCYQGHPLPVRLPPGLGQGAIHVFEGAVGRVDGGPGDPGWYIYRAVEPHMGPNSPGRFIATWHPMPDRPLDLPDPEFTSVQAILTAVGDDGDFDLELRYHRCGWAGSDAANDWAIVGLDGYEGEDGPGWMWPGSLGPDTLMLCDLSNVREPGVFRYEFRGGQPFGCGPQDPPPAGPDRCDDGNHLPGDGCSPACYVEPDLDGDGVFDAPFPDSVDPLGVYDECADPEAPCNGDQDGDGVPDADDNCVAVQNDDQLDYDGDGFGDLCDDNDDGDGMIWPPDPARPFVYPDNCPFLYSNATRRIDPDPDFDVFAQTPDTDRDGMGDPCDPDDDGDGVLDCGVDGICHPERNGYNEDRDLETDEPGECAAGQANCTGLNDLYDNDQDGFIDERSEVEFPRQPYPGPDEGEDNCRLVPNPDQLDTDGDGIGDACDPDPDGDGVESCEGGVCGRALDQRDNDRDGRVDERFECDRGCEADSDLIDQDRDGFVDEGFEPDVMDPPARQNDICPLIADPEQRDSNADGIGDMCSDFDGDGVDGHADNCPYLANDQVDLDLDGEGDACDDDDDGDGVPDVDDNCPRHANDDQADHERDGQGDICDPDDDEDGALDGDDVCPLTFDPGQADTDRDGAGDACDDDDDGDGVLDGDDICPLHADVDQADLDGDGAGDACDEDDDGDRIADGDDLCPRDPDPAQRDLDGDRLGDVCDPDDDDDGIADDVDLCPTLADDQRDTDGDGAGDACDADDDDDGVADAVDLCPRVADPEQRDLDGDGIGDACDDRDDRPFDARTPEERCAMLIAERAPTAERLRHCPPVADSCQARPGRAPAPGVWLLLLAVTALLGRRRGPAAG